MILISTHQLKKSYSNRLLFENLSFGIEEKQRIGFIGPNGAGKSTLLKILTGEVESDEGTVARKRGLRIGFLQQTPLFKPGAKILETILQHCKEPTQNLARALELMAHLELTQFGDEFLIAELSGGWQKRVALARELIHDPELLLLDEPTNHLDLSSILWLEEFLLSGPFALVMVTHDRLFLQRVANRIMDLDPRNPGYLLNVDGDYSQYLTTKESELAALKRHEQVEKNRLRRETEWLRRGSIARQTKQSARIQAAQELQKNVEDLRLQNQNRQVDLTFGEADHAPKKLVEAIQISKSFGSRILFENVDLLITPKSRLGILGDNGCGKTTLIKALLGMESVDQGKVKRNEGLEYAYFEQSRETLRPELSVMQNICPQGDYVTYQGQSLHVRSYLDRFFFSGHKTQLPVRELSGGEQARLRLAQLMLKPSQILVLDEPTNDLDMDTLESLEISLKDFNGAVILVTHDRYFLDAVANQILAFPLSQWNDKKLELFSSYFQWESWFQDKKNKMLSLNTLQKATAPEGVGGPSKKTRLSFKEKFELENMETSILELEGELTNLKMQSKSPTVLNDHIRLSEIYTRISQLESTIEQKYTRWSELEERHSLSSSKNPN